MTVASSAATRGKVALKWLVEHPGRAVPGAAYCWARVWVSAPVEYGPVKRRGVTFGKRTIEAHRNADGG